MHRRFLRGTFGSALALFTLGLIAARCSSSTDSEDAGSSDTGSTADATPADASGGCDPVTCDAFDLAPSASSYNASSHALKLGFKASAPTIMGGSISFTFARRGMSPGVQSQVFQINDRAVTADLTRWLSLSDAQFFGGLSITLVSQCGRTSNINNLQAMTRNDAGGIVITGFQCM